MPAALRADLRDLRADLHSHSCISDGTLAPEAVVARAAEQGVELFALTDHDEVAGLAAASAAAHRVGLPFVPGVEVSVTWGGSTVHIVGLGIDPAAGGLQERLAAVRAGRTRRAQQMGDELAQAGIDGAYEGALAYAGNPQMISRTHFARYLVETGHCRDVREVFTRYLVAGKPGYVPHAWAALDEAVDMIRDMRRFAELARAFGFEASGGSDFHGPGEAENVELGRVARLPSDLVPVWHRFV